MPKTFLKRLLLAVLVFILPLGFQAQMGYETASVRTYVTWFGLRVTPYKPVETALDQWIKNIVGHHPETEDWTQTTLGLWWFPGVIGTPPGNWMHLRRMHESYLATSSETAKQEILDFARQMARAKDYHERHRINELWNAR